MQLLDLNGEPHKLLKLSKDEASQIISHLAMQLADPTCDEITVYIFNDSE